jgi:hypothetical protein
MEALYGIVLLLVIGLFVSAPLRRPAAAAEMPAADPRLADLEARKEAKYGEIRDAELDHAAGKLSDEDYRRQDAELRSEAVEILDQLDNVASGER